MQNNDLKAYDVNAAAQHQVMSDTAYENHGKFLLGLEADPMA